MMKYANLHLHSTHSDGGYRPAHLVRLAKSLGYSAVSLTDHEAISGLPELLKEAKKEGIEAMSGIELYAKFNGKSFHIVGLDFDYENKTMTDFVDTLTENQIRHMKAITEEACEKGIWPGASWETIRQNIPSSIRWICNDHIYTALDQMGIVPFSDREITFRTAFKETEASKLYKPQRFSAQEVIDVIHAAGGIAVLAHPDECHFDDGYVDGLIKIGLDGIETSHPDITERSAKLGIHKAMKHRLYCCGGTDHTGPLSACDGKYAIPAYQGVTLEEYADIKKRRFG